MHFSTGTTAKVDDDSNNNIKVNRGKEAQDPRNNNVAAQSLYSGSDCQQNPDHHVQDLFTSFKRNYDSNVASHGGTPQHSDPNSSDYSFDILNNFALPIITISRDNPEPPKQLNLVKFITAGIANHLKTLGVEDLDCKEFVETWLSHRRQKRWKQSLPNPIPSYTTNKHPSHSCFPPLQDFLKQSGMIISGQNDKRISNVLKPDAVKGFHQSEPNSSMLGMSGSGTEELGRFSSKMEGVRINLNNASCTLIQGTMVLMLPYLKLLTGNHLEGINHRTFIQDWIQIVSGMAKELRPGSAKESKVMLKREFQSLLSESKDLYSHLSKLFRKVKSLHKENEKACKKSLGRLHPRSLTNRSRFHPDAIKETKDKDASTSTSTPPSKVIPSETIEFSPIPLHRVNITAVELFKDHTFLSRTNTGSIVVKNGINMEWESFVNLPFQRRRDLLLSVLEDLRWTLNSTSVTTSRIKELFIEGYPESICAKIKDSLAYLKKMAKQEEDIPVLRKVTIANQVKSFLDTLARLVRILKDTMEIAKSFYKCIKQTNQLCFPGTFGKIQVDLSNLRRKSDEDMTEAVPLNSLKAKLLIPFPISADPIQDQFFLSSF